MEQNQDIGGLTYIGTKLVNAQEMTLGQYNHFRNWDMPADEDPNAMGYIIQYPDGYISWSPALQFQEAYREIHGLNFGLAIEAMKKGYKVARRGWNGKGMFCILVPGTENVQFTPGTPYYEAVGGDAENQILPHIDMWTVDATGRRAMLPGWLASQSDMLADDWEIIG